MSGYSQTSHRNFHGKFQMVIGLEVHAQLRTHSKIFCDCSTCFGAEPNTQICPVCAGFPGVLPVLNRESVDKTIKTGLAIHGKIRKMSEFSRKNYFYPDLPAGYQITQYEYPLVEQGYLMIDVGEKRKQQQKKIGITRIHMEVDAGKSLHEGIAGKSWVDLNRTGVPLMEIVSEPDIRSPEEAGAYLKKLRTILRYLDVCDGNMEQGSFRCDANVSVRPHENTEFGTRCELKNMNSIRNVMHAIVYEADRQVDAILSGNLVVQETRLWDATKGVTRSMRSKEDAHDYRYFPEPDLPPLMIQQERIKRISKTLPELPDQKRARFRESYILSDYDATLLSASRELGDFYEAVVKTLSSLGHSDPKMAANWVAVELLGRLNKEDKDITVSPVSAEHLGKLIAFIQDKTISGKIAKEVFDLIWTTGDAPDQIIEKKGLRQVTDASTIENAVDQILQAHPNEIAQYRNGKKKLLGFFIGQVMKATRGKANPGIVHAILEKKL